MYGFLSPSPAHYLRGTMGGPSPKQGKTINFPFSNFFNSGQGPSSLAPSGANAADGGGSGSSSLTLTPNSSAAGNMGSVVPGAAGTASGAHSPMRGAGDGGLEFDLDPESWFDEFDSLSSNGGGGGLASFPSSGKAADAIAESIYSLIGEVFDMRGVFKWIRKSLMTFVQIT